MAQLTGFSNPLLLGFDQIEAMLDRIAKTTGDSFPPYNIERFAAENGDERYCITLAVAGFRGDDLDVTLDGLTLTITGGQNDDTGRDYLHRGIAARRFTRCFVLAQGMRVDGAEVENGLLALHLARPMPEATIKRIPITDKG